MTFNALMNKKLAIALLASFFACGVFGNSECHSQEKVKVRPPKATDGKLKWQLSENKKFQIEINQTVNTSAEVGGREMKTDTTTKNKLEMKILKVNENGKAKAETTVKEISIKLKSPGMALEFDSKNPEEGHPTFKQNLGPMVDLKVPHQFDTLGNASKPEIDDSFIEEVKRTNPIFGDKNKLFREIMARSHFPLPEEAKVGKTWTVKEKASLGPGQSTINKTTYTYLGVTEKNGKSLHVIKGDMKIEVPNGVGNVEIEIDEQKSTLYFYFDGKKGHVDHSTLNQKVEMLVSVMGQEIAQTVTQEMTCKTKIAK